MTYYPDLGVEITGDPNHVVLHSAQNPVTRFAITLLPPIELNSADDAGLFSDWLLEYCREAWKFRQSPEVIDASGWRDGQPAAI